MRSRLGSWADAYRGRGHPVTLRFTGGPADGHTATVPATQVPQARHWAPPDRRTARSVTLHRYVNHGNTGQRWEIRMVYTGTAQSAGPVAGLPNEPEWS